jgi:tripartite-type tricarboxylate transporter receptor subunit TctC
VQTRAPSRARANSVVLSLSCQWDVPKIPFFKKGSVGVVGRRSPEIANISIFIVKARVAFLASDRKGATMITKRHFLSVTCASGIACVLPGIRQAARSQAVRSTAHILVGFPPGGTTDVIARLIASELKNYSSSVIVETRSGAAGRVALEALKSSAADGSVLSVAPLEGITLFPYIYKQLRYDGLQDFVPVTAVCAVPNLISVGPKVPVDVRTLADFVLWCRTNPKQVTYGTPGAGTPLHFTGVLYRFHIGLNRRVLW